MLSLPKHDTYVIRLVLKLKILKKSVMLNAEKHLYRFSQTVQRSGRDASTSSA
jgi:hypothetical protein